MFKQTIEHLGLLLNVFVCSLVSTKVLNRGSGCMHIEKMYTNWINVVNYLLYSDRGSV